jgi:hypothetical protein
MDSHLMRRGTQAPRLADAPAELAAGAADR